MARREFLNDERIWTNQTIGQFGTIQRFDSRTVQPRRIQTSKKVAKATIFGIIKTFFKGV